jgi:hypothetical protein
MSRRSSTSFALLSGLITSAIPVSGEAENIQVVQIPIVTDARIEFFRLPWRPRILWREKWREADSSASGGG